MTGSTEIKVKITNADHRDDEDTQTLREWDGITDGEILKASQFKNGKVWINAPRQFNETCEGDPTEIYPCEFEIVE